MSVIISKSENSTVIATLNKRYVINQYPSKGIEVIIADIGPKRLSDELEVRMWIPEEKTKTTEGSTGDMAWIAVYPIPLKVLEDIQERTKGDIKVEDVSEYNKETEAGEEFFVRIKGNVIISTT